MIDSLPSTSLLAEAMHDDDELAMMAATDENPITPSVRTTEWSPERDTLAAIYDQISALIQVTVSGNGGKPPRLKPHQRPKSAVERMRQQARKAQHNALVARFREAE